MHHVLASCLWKSEESIELELWMVVRHRVGAENRTCILCKNSKCSESLSHLYSLCWAFLFVWDRAHTLLCSSGWPSTLNSLLNATFWVLRLQVWAITSRSEGSLSLSLFYIYIILYVWLGSAVGTPCRWRLEDSLLESSPHSGQLVVPFAHVTRPSEGSLYFPLYTLVWCAVTEKLE